MSFLLALLLTTPPSLSGKPTCGDDNQRGSEECDGSDLDGQTCSSLGYTGGALACAADCTFDISDCTSSSTPVCGDGIAEGYEECDGADDTGCAGACSAHCACPATSASDLEIHVIDVGQGDGILVVSPDGYTMLVDAGTGAQDATIAAYMASIGITGLDYTLVSHMDADHVGGMDGILQTYPEVTTCFDHGGSATTTQYDEYDAEAGDRRTALYVDDTIDMGSSVTVDVVHSHAGSGSENGSSVVIRITHGDNTYLLGGDCETMCEESFDPGPIQAYKVHHHGSDSSTSASLLSAMDPYTALISVGGSNSYGHPDQSTLDALTDAQATIYRTDLDGDLELIGDGSAYSVNGEAVCSGADTRVCGETDVGACEYGTLSCTAGMWDSTCSGEVAATTEDCGNGNDDDCDGLTDEADGDCAAGADHVVILQVAYDTPGTDSLEEFVDLYNPLLVDVDLDGWTVSDGAGSWTVPVGTTISAGGYLSIAKDAAGFSALYGLDPDVEGMSISLNNDGDVVVLADSGGTEVDRVAYEDYEAGWSISAATGEALERVAHDVDIDAAADWTTVSPAAPYGGTIVENDCGNGTCDAGEDCESCAVDCDGVLSGKPSNRYCCGNGTCESVGEDGNTCAVDCP